MRIRMTLSLTLALVLWTAPAQAQDKIYTSMSTAQIEQILRKLDVDYKKSASKTAEDVFFYDYKRDKNSVRLHYFGGKDLMLDVMFKDYPLETINRWNARAKFSRVSLQKRDKTPWTVLEMNLDILGGVTENNVRHFIKSFHEEISEFDRFLEGNDAAPPNAAGDKIFTGVTPEKLEAVLKDMKLAYKKQSSNNNKMQFYDFETKAGKCRVYNFDGKDLMVDCAFKKIPLEAVNKYNFEKKFIRAVLYTPKDAAEYTSLEANLDCVAGISENMIRHFLMTFDLYALGFQAYVNKN